MKQFCFTVDDNVRFLRELNAGQAESIFDHPYLALYRRLHERFGLKVQLNLFYRDPWFDLSQMTDRYAAQWAENSDWLRMSFHSEAETVRPYEFSPYEEVYADCKAVQEEICRFASPASLGKTTTVHYCLNTQEGLQALKDNGVTGLLGLYGTDEAPRTSYQTKQEDLPRLRAGEAVEDDGVIYGAIDLILNLYSKEEILSRLEKLNHRTTLRVMIHEQYFYPDYRAYQPDFAEKLEATFEFLTERGYESRFFEEMI